MLKGIQRGLAVITSITTLIFNSASVEDIKLLFSTIDWHKPDIWIRLGVNILFIASWLWIAISRERELNKYINARPYLVIKGTDKQEFDGFYRYGITIENHPIRKANNGSTNTNISVDFTIFDKKTHTFRCTRFDEMFTRQEMRSLGLSPIRNTSVSLEADIDKRIAFFLGRFEDNKHLYIHND